MIGDLKVSTVAMALISVGCMSYAVLMASGYNRLEKKCEERSFVCSEKLSKCDSRASDCNRALDDLYVTMSEKLIAKSPDGSLTVDRWLYDYCNQEVVDWKQAHALNVQQIAELSRQVYECEEKSEADP